MSGDTFCCQNSGGKEYWPLGGLPVQEQRWGRPHDHSCVLGELASGDTLGPKPVRQATVLVQAQELRPTWRAEARKRRADTIGRSWCWLAARPWQERTLRFLEDDSRSHTNRKVPQKGRFGAMGKQAGYQGEVEVLATARTPWTVQIGGLGVHMQVGCFCTSIWGEEAP